MRDIIASFHERMGLNAYVSGDYDKAEARFRKLLAREGETIRVLRNLGVILLAKGDVEGAKRYLAREEELFGPSYHRHCALGDLAYAAGCREEALRRYRAALAEPEASPSSGIRASSADLVGIREAICADRAAFERSRLGHVKFEEAQATRSTGRLEEAVSAFEEAFRLDPSYWPALNNAGAILLNELHMPERALPFFERAFALSSSPQCARNAELAKVALANQQTKKRKSR